MLATGSSNGIGETKPVNLKNELVVGHRYLSTAAASDASTPPAEKFEYQAEVYLN